MTKVDVLTDGSRLRERQNAGSHRARGLTVSLLVRTCGGCRGSRPRIVVVVFARHSTDLRSGGPAVVRRRTARVSAPRARDPRRWAIQRYAPSPPPRDAVRPLIPLPLPSSHVFFVSSADLRRPSLFSRVSPPPALPSSRSQDRQLISVREFGPDFKGRLIQVLWPETNTWYNAKVLKVNVKAKTATLYYVDSNEREDIDCTPPCSTWR